MRGLLKKIHNFVFSLSLSLIFLFLFLPLIWNPFIRRIRLKLERNKFERILEKKSSSSEFLQTKIKSLQMEKVFIETTIRLT